MYQFNPLLEHSGIHPDMMKLVNAITTKYPTSKDLAAALKQFSAEQGGNKKLDEWSEILNQDMDHKQYQRYVTNLIPNKRFRMFITQWLGSWGALLGTLSAGTLAGYAINKRMGHNVGAALSAIPSMYVGLKANEKIHDWNLRNDYKRLKNMSVDDILKSN